MATTAVADTTRQPFKRSEVTVGGHGCCVACAVGVSLRSVLCQHPPQCSAPGPWDGLSFRAGAQASFFLGANA